MDARIQPRKYNGGWLIARNLQFFGKLSDGHEMSALKRGQVTDGHGTRLRQSNVILKMQPMATWRRIVSALKE
jgi:hypothetical protein